jgi:hypothetical protein
LKVKQQCNRALDLISSLRASGIEPTLESELDDLETWCYLGFYFAEKIDAGVALQSYRLSGKKADRNRSVKHLQECVHHWEEVIRLTQLRYAPMPYVSMGHHEQKWPEFISFHWMDFLDEVEADVAYARENPIQEKK